MNSNLGKYYDRVANGEVFFGSTVPAGTAFPISTGTAVTVGLWNVSSKKAAVLLGLDLGFTSGTIALGQVGIGLVQVGTVLGTPLTAFNIGSGVSGPQNAYLGSGKECNMRFSPAATTTLSAAAAAAAVPYWLGKSIESATAGLGVFDGHYDLDGKIIVPSGWLAFLCGSVAQTALFAATLTWAEIDAP